MWLHCATSFLSFKRRKYILIPESSFNLYGEHGVLNYIFERLKIKKHCVIVVAEGAGSAILDKNVHNTGKLDKSGNPVLPDIGILLKDEILNYSKKNKMRSFNEIH